MAEFKTHAIINNEFINIYNDENPIMEAGEECFALILNNFSWHLPVAVKALIKRDKFIDGGNKRYTLEIQSILESPEIINKFMVGQPFNVVIEQEDEIRDLKRTVYYGPGLDLTKVLFMVEGYFVRDSEAKIRQLQKEYISVVKEQILEQLKDIETY
jgi:hypothetical protein